ncbi:hypothetical protein JX265_003628 [Neoarthrinium moseri]|uniref:Uncharacterized protein n=1 Tax=Neoarthrinium moseri TaxID=1658444 RepID=A0A9P9WS76_9PEZI|nr:hypothetical protein JX266_001189 [Neoarthrinium moseri]KAI1877620.1 hypothetical protein JX265_003628 [Neoarthrinium moseri]
MASREAGALLGTTIGCTVGELLAFYPAATLWLSYGIACPGLCRTVAAVRELTEKAANRRAPQSTIPRLRLPVFDKRGALLAGLVNEGRTLDMTWGATCSSRLYPSPIAGHSHAAGGLSAASLSLL